MSRSLAFLRSNSYHPIEPGHSLRVERSLTSRCGYLYHAHDCFELLYIASGSGKCIVGDHKGRFRPGELVLVAPDLPHAWFTEGFLPGGEVLDINVVWFDKSWIERAPEAIPEIEAISSLLARARAGLRFSVNLAARLDAPFRALGVQHGLEAVGTLFQILAALTSDPDAVALAPEAPATAFDAKELDRLNAISRFLEFNYREELTLDGVADQFGISASTLNSLLKRYLRTTFLDHLTRIRVEEARAQLRSTTMDITTIAFSAGFRSLATFNRRFRDEVGQSPTEYRLAHRR